MSKVLLALGMALALQPLYAQNALLDFPELMSTIDHPVIKTGQYAISHHFTDKHNGVSHAYGFQTLNGLKIEGAYFDAHAQSGKVISFHETFLLKGHLENVESHQLEYSETLTAFLQKHTDHFPEGVSTSESWKPIGPNQFELVDQQLSSEPIRIKKTYAPTPNGVVPSWSMSILLKDNSHWYYAIINAIDGSVINQYDWMLSCTIQHDHSAHAFSNFPGETQLPANKKADGASYNVFAYPIESPIHGSQAVIENPADKAASPFGWHDSDGVEGPEFTITHGNNVYASEDRNNRNVPGYSPDGGSSLTFSASFSSSSSPTENLDAAITNLFYANNVIHDVMYRYGFDEESGNFQINNYGNGGLGGDEVLADAQDGSGTDNANFGTPPDGINPRMQMYLWGVNGSIGLKVEAPASNAGTYKGSGSSFGASLTQTPIKGKLVLVSDGSSQPTLGCNTLSNPSAISGNIALIERGTCTFVDKVRNAQNAGAIAVVVFTDLRPLIPMGGDGSQSDIKIPSLMIDRNLGLALVAELAKAEFEIQLYDSTGAQGLDSDFDNGVMAHEYGHGISNRLTGGAFNTNCLTNIEQMGEGWSDFFALVMTHQPSHKASTPRGMGTYLLGQPTNGAGIRPYPYTVNTTVSPYTYSQIATLSVPHGIGSVWCSMLWDLYWALIDEYGYDPDIYEGTGGNNICIQLVVDGMKLQPCNPGFTDARDAILMADLLNNKGQNEKLIWTAFSGRGLGWDADGGDPNNRLDGTSGFELPPKFNGYVGITKTGAEQIDETESLDYEIVIANGSGEKYLNVVITDTIPDRLQIDETSLNCDWEINGQIMTLTLDELDSGESITCNYSTLPKPGYYTDALVEDGAETDNENWTVVADKGDTPWKRQFMTKAEGNWAWFIEEDFVESDHSLMYDIGLIKPGMSLTFQHLYSTDGRDGGVVEFTEDGETWFDAADDFVQNGYNSQVKENPTSALNGRRLFAGTSNGFVTSEINLDSYAGKDILVRFRFVSDAKFNGTGWYIDDLKVGNLVMVTNRAHALYQGKTSSSRVNTTIMETDGSTDGIADRFTPAHIAALYPNPSTDITTIILPIDLAKAQFVITTINGEQVMDGVLAGGHNPISVSSLAQGLYIVSITQNGITERHRLIKN